MTPFVMVAFHGMQPQPSLESAAHRWVARLESVGIVIQRAVIDIEHVRSANRVRLAAAFVDGGAASATCSHSDPYVAIADTFRALRRNALASTSAVQGA